MAFDNERYLGCTDSARIVLYVNTLFPQDLGWDTRSGVEGIEGRQCMCVVGDTHGVQDKHFAPKGGKGSWVEVLAVVGVSVRVNKQSHVHHHT